MEREYTYAELCRMKKKRVLRIAGYKNIKHALKDGVNRSVDMNGNVSYVNLSKKYIAKIIASDR
jgi:hypothetical protein